MNKKGLTLVGLIGIIVVAALLVVCLWGLTGCKRARSPQTADRKAQEQTEQSMGEAFSQVGMPAIKNFQELKLSKMIYELRDREDLICYAYLKSLDGKPIFLGKCIGYGLPYCVQFSNPEKIIRNKDALVFLAGVRDDNFAGGDVSTIPQPEPNGLFMPQSLSATWLIMIDPKTGDARPVYIEPEIIVSPFPLGKEGSE